MAILTKTGFSKDLDSFKAGQEAAKMALGYVKQPDLIILFASIFHNHEMVLKGVRAVFGDISLFGGSSFGEITNYGMIDNSVVLMALEADKIKFSLGLGNDSDQNPLKAGEDAAREAIKGLDKEKPQIGIFVAEMLASDKVLTGLQNVLGKEFGLFGGCSSGNRKVPVGNPEFSKGYQYLNNRVYQHSVPLLLLSGDFKYSFGVGHGWRPLGNFVKVGKAEGNTIYEFDDIKAFDFYKRYLGESNFVPYPLEFYQNDYLVLRAVTGTRENGGLAFTTEIPSGTEAKIARGSRPDVLKSSGVATKQALEGLEGYEPRLAIIASCISRRTMLGTRIYKETEVIQGVLGKELPLIGFYCAGEYGPVSGGSLYHNFSVCLCLLGEEIEEPEKVKREISKKPKIAKDKILIITKQENLVSSCKTALTGLEFDFEWIKDNLELKDSLKKHIPNIVILEIENETLIGSIKEVEQGIQIILLIEKEKEASSKEIIQKLDEGICDFCFIAFGMLELQFLVKKALQMNKVYIKNRITERRLIETEEDLNEAEDSIEITERVLMESYKQIEMAKNGLAQKVKERTKELEQARNGLEIKVQERMKELKNSEERLKILFEFAPYGIYLNDLKGNFVDGNKAAEELIGYQKDELIGKNFLKLKLLSLGEIPKAAAFLAKNALGQPVGPEEFILNRKDGTRVIVEIRSFPIKIKGQTLVLGSVRNITEHKKAEEQQRKLMKDLEDLNKIMTGRELRMVELKKEVNKLNEELGRPASYDVS